MSNLGRFFGVQDPSAALAQVVAAPGALTSVQEATANGSDLATTQALANSLKIKYNAAQVDIAALRTHITTLETALRTAGTIG